VLLCSDDERFGGSGYTRSDRYTTTADRHNDFEQSLWLTLPPLSMSFLRLVR